MRGVVGAKAGSEFWLHVHVSDMTADVLVCAHVHLGVHLRGGPPPSGNLSQETELSPSKAWVLRARLPAPALWPGSYSPSEPRFPLPHRLQECLPPGPSTLPRLQPAESGCQRPVLRVCCRE